MCIAAGMAGMLGTIASVVGTGVSAVGQIQAANAQAAASKYQADQSRIMAEDALKRGAAEEQAQRRKTSALEGRQRAVMAASNVDLGSGSPLDILSDTAVLGELDAQTVRSNANREASQMRAQAGLFDMQASSAKSAGVMSAFGTVLGGVTTLADKWYKPVTNSTAKAKSSSGSYGVSGSW